MESGEGRTGRRAGEAYGLPVLVPDRRAPVGSEAGPVRIVGRRTLVIEALGSLACEWKYLFVSVNFTCLLSFFLGTQRQKSNSSPHTCCFRQFYTVRMAATPCDLGTNYLLIIIL